MPEIQADTLIAGRYRLQERLDAGGRAQVWKGMDEELAREVAVKILVTPPGGDQEFVALFREEAQVEASLKHPNIVEVFDWGHDGDANYIVMELLEGRSVRDRLDADGPMPWHTVLTAGRQMAAALAYAHHEGVAHGNINADAVMVTAEGHATGIGFGLQCRGQCETPPTPDQDTYALGGLMYEMLTGASPFGPRPAELPESEPWPEPVHKFAPDAPHELDRIVQRAIAADPADRYVGAAELQADLDELARPKSRAWLWATIAVLAVAIAAAATWFLATQQNIVVPDVVGQPQAQASAGLSSVGLKMVTTGNAPSTSVDVGAVVSESPAAGARVRKGAQISVVVSTGKPSAAVPSVAGVDLQAASSQIASAGLIVGTVTRQNSTTYPADTVISSDPAAGVQLTLGASVNLVVSAGQETVTVPDVRGLARANATTKLTNVGLKVDVGQSFSGQPVDIVVSQGPAPGTIVPSGSTVSISVSKGAAPVKVPNVIDALETDARQALRDAGLVPVSTTESGTAGQKGRVMRQNPIPNQTVAAGSQVTIVVGK